MPECAGRVSEGSFLHESEKLFTRSSLCNNDIKRGTHEIGVQHGFLPR